MINRIPLCSQNNIQPTKDEANLINRIPLLINRITFVPLFKISLFNLVSLVNFLMYNLFQIIQKNYMPPYTLNFLFVPFIYKVTFIIFITC